jgi:restriction system protein
MANSLALVFYVTFPFILGFIVIALLRRSTPHEPVDPEVERDRPDEVVLERICDLDANEFEKMIRRFLTAFGLEEATLTSTRDAVEVIAYWPQELIGGKYILNFSRSLARTPIESRAIREFKEAVYEERALKGIYVTTSFFSHEAREIADHYGVELVDGERLIQILRDRQPSLLAQLEKPATL